MCSGNERSSFIRERSPEPLCFLAPALHTLQVNKEPKISEGKWGKMKGGLGEARSAVHGAKRDAQDQDQWQVQDQ